MEVTGAVVMQVAISDLICKISLVIPSLLLTSACILQTY